MDKEVCLICGIAGCYHLEERREAKMNENARLRAALVWIKDRLPLPPVSTAKREQRQAHGDAEAQEWLEMMYDAASCARAALTPAPEAPKGGEGGGNMWTGMGPNTPAPRLDPNCQCICHSQPGVMHVAACCSTLTLRAGKRYRDGNGEVKGPLHSIHWENGEEMLTDSYVVWHPDGTLAGGTREDKRSLVAEVE